MRAVLIVALIGLMITTLITWAFHCLVSRGADRRVPVTRVLDRTVEWQPAPSPPLHHVNGSGLPGLSNSGSWTAPGPRW